MGAKTTLVALLALAGCVAEDDRAPIVYVPTSAAGSETGVDESSSDGGEESSEGSSTSGAPEPPDTTTGTTTGVGSETGADTGPEPPPDCSPNGARDCSPGPGRQTCADLATMFGAQVNGAIDAVIAEHPTWFDFEQGAACCPFVVAAPDDYVQLVAQKITEGGLCSIQDPNAGDEIGVKLNNACAESHDIYTAEGFVRRPPGGHTATCWPGWF